MGKKLTIGADPEIGLIAVMPNGRNEQLNASEFIRTEKYSPYGEIGLDGHSYIGELRPAPSDNPDVVTENIAYLIPLVTKYLPENIKVVAGSIVAGKDPIGGHIHFGGITADELLLRALDAYLAAPLALLEVKESARKRRMATNYGKLSVYEDKRWGFEYRTPPSWLVSGAITRVVLSLGFMIAHAYQERSLLPPPNIPDEVLFNECNKNKLQEYMPEIRKAWKRMPLYESHFATRINYLNSVIVSGKSWYEGESVLAHWRHAAIRPLPFPQQTPLMVQDEAGNVTEIAEHPSTVEVGRVIGNPNDDYCDEIARAVSPHQGMVVVIYGLSEDRPYDVAVNNVWAADDLMAQGFHVTTRRFGQYATESEDGRLCIGLSRAFRARYVDRVDVIQRIIEMAALHPNPEP